MRVSQSDKRRNQMGSGGRTNGENQRGQASGAGIQFPISNPKPEPRPRRLHLCGPVARVAIRWGDGAPIGGENLLPW